MALKRIKANMHIIYAVILAGFLFATVQGFFTVGPVIGDVDGELYTEPSSAQIGNLIWTRTWGGSDADDSFTLWKYGDYIYTAGGTFSYGDPNGDVTIVKWDTQGNLIWNITWGGSEWETAHDIIVVNEYIYVLGETMSYGHGASDMLLLKYDTDGNLIWNTTYGGTDSDCGTALWTDGNYLYAVGGTASFGDGSNNVWVMKIDFDGNSIWDTTWGFGGYSSGEGIFADSTGVYVTGASDSIDGSGSDEGVIIKYDLSGNLIWNDTFGNPGKFDFPEDMWGNEKGIYIIADSEQNDETNDVSVYAFYKNGTLIWSVTIPKTGDEAPMGIFGNEYNLYITGFKDQESNPDTDDIFLLQMSYNGDLLAEETWGGDFMDSGEAVWCDNNEIYVSGIYAVDNQSNTDQLLIKWALNNLPKAQFEYTKNGLTVSFTFTGDIGDDPAEFQWNFGDGSPIANEMNPTHTYPAAGQYTVSLTVIDADGDRSEYSAIVEVSENADDTGNNDQTSSTSGGDNDSESDQNDVKGIDGYPVFMLLIGILPIALIAMRINKLRRER